MGDRYVKSDENKKILYMDATNLYGHSMSQLLPYDKSRCGMVILISIGIG